MVENDHWWKNSGLGAVGGGRAAAAGAAAAATVTGCGRPKPVITSTPPEVHAVMEQVVET